MKIVRNAPWIGLSLLILLGLGGVRSYAWWQASIAPVTAKTTTSQGTLFEVPPGSSAQEIGQSLQAAGLIQSQQAWQIWTRFQQLKGRSGGFQAGTYEISPTESMDAIALKIWTGDIVRNQFTIPEGWSLRQMAEYFEQRGFFKAEAFLQAAQKISPQQYPWLPPNLPFLEGFLFPDTYEISGTTLTPEQALRQMLDRFEQTALPLYQSHTQSQQSTNPLQLSLLQWVTLASIVEKEAVVPSERRLIAGVFTNRLKQGMTLGSDPTVEYGLGIRQTKEQPLTLAQVRTPSPYNTYITPGLPPTPIASPGLASLKATLEPEQTSYLYFVARYDGTHVFSRTLAEHESAQTQIRDRVEAETTPAPTSSPQSTPERKKP
ncbi:endolytic transglycosylase MltG [Alkalinema sp. FACHB-956]|uniref:endolytic transglycosylase MltG n=1 Tax=Alkalinema sp. FACHB-956 TaxID=2692768 RepID=UPI0016830E9B|nr:endolytic transglycosylase MltG [Alkalinema sp. FACHB-956]MBD2326850.1 endolytic transglycosylase MltG [Alkalinema sp. FACHB-956]